MAAHVCMRCEEPHLDADTIRARLLGCADETKPEGGRLCLTCAAVVYDELQAKAAKAAREAAMRAAVKVSA